MDDEKTGLVTDWPRPIHLDEKWAAWIGAVQQRIEQLEAVAHPDQWSMRFASASARLRHDEGMPSERAPLARSRTLKAGSFRAVLEAEYDAIEGYGCGRLRFLWSECERAIAEAQNETGRALDIAHATHERLRAVERELATVLQLCADLVEPIRRTPAGSEIETP